MGQNAGYLKQINVIPSFIQLKKKLFNKKKKIVQQTPWIRFFLSHPKLPRARAKPTRWKFAAFAYYHREKPNLKTQS